MSVDKFGLSSWGQPAETGRFQNNFSDEDRIPFARLEEGNNIVRIITEPYRFFQTRLKSDNNKVGKRVKLSAPLKDDPAVKAGAKKQERWYAGIINRKTSQVEILDISTLVYNDLLALEDDIEYGKPQKYDINIRKTPKAGPSGYYSVVPRPPAELSEADVSLRDSAMEKLEASLERLSAPNKPENVQKVMEEVGFTGETANSGSNGKSAESLPTASDDDYSFDAPAAQA